MSNRAIKIYACGGCGVNIATKLKGLDHNLDVTFVDTSTANLEALNNEENTYIVPSLDGAGKLRSKTYEAFNEDVETLLIEHKASEGLNIVISSLSGGSGSMIAPLIAYDLIKEGKTVLVIGVGSRNSVIEIKNTLNTIQTYNNFTHNLRAPIAFSYVDDPVRSIADKSITSLVNILSLITDKTRTKEFDTADLHHFINYDKVTSLPPSLASINASLLSEEKNPLLVDNSHLASTIIVSDDSDVSCGHDVPEYLAKALIIDPDFGNSNKGGTTDFRIDCIVGHMNVIVKGLEEELTKFGERIKSSRVTKIEEVSSKDDRGMVF